MSSFANSLAQDVHANPRHVASASFRRTLAGTRAKDIAPVREMVYVWDSDSIVTAFKVHLLILLLNRPQNVQ